MYPSRFRLPEVTAHVLAGLERRRPAFESLDEDAAGRLRAEAVAQLRDIRAQFLEVAADPAYFDGVEKVVLEVAVPRWLKVARERHALERRGFDLWRGGDVWSRIAYAAAGLVLGLVILRVRVLPAWLEFLPVLLFVFGPLIPDLQLRLHERRHRRALLAIAADMEAESERLLQYRPLAALPGGPEEP